MFHPWVFFPEDALSNSQYGLETPVVSCWNGLEPISTSPTKLDRVQLSTNPTITNDRIGDDTEFYPSSAYVRSELILHWLFLAIAAIILLLSFLMKSEGEKSVFLPGFASPMPETCSAKRFFQIDCPGCGMTRAFISISAGQFSRAWNFNPASFIVYLFVAVQIPWHTIQIWRLKNQKRPLVTRWAYMAPVAMVIVMTIHWAWKLLHQFG